MGLNDFIEFFEQRWQTMTANPGTFFGGFLLALFAGFGAGTWWQHQQVANADKLVEGYKAEIARLESEVDEGAALKERMKIIDDKFTEQQVQRLESELGIAPPGEVEIVPSSGDSKAWDQVFSAFANTGWKVGTSEPLKGWSDPINLALAENSDGLRVVLSLGNNEDSRAVRAAFEGADIPYLERSIAEGETQVPQVWVISSEDVAEAPWVEPAPSGEPDPEESIFFPKVR